jgi:hypothetical protein
MKTAIQLMLWYLENEGLEQSGAYYKAKMLLEKEKDQMLDFGLYVKKNGWVGCKIEDMFEDYNNQNK